MNSTDGANLFQCRGSWEITLPPLPTTHQHPHPRQDHHHAHQVPKRQRHSIHYPQPDQRDGDIDSAIGGIDPACRCGMKGEQPGKQRQGKRRRDQQQRGPAALEDQVGQVAPNDLSKRCQDEQQGGPKHGNWSARLAVTRPRITGPSWAGGAATAASREELLPWFGGTAIPTALVTGPTRAGGPTATSSREHLLSKGRTGDQSKDCQSAHQTCSNDALQQVLKQRERSGA